MHPNDIWRCNKIIGTSLPYYMTLITENVKFWTYLFLEITFQLHYRKKLQLTACMKYASRLKRPTIDNFIGLARHWYSNNFTWYKNWITLIFCSYELLKSGPFPQLSLTLFTLFWNLLKWHEVEIFSNLLRQYYLETDLIMWICLMCAESVLSVTV